MSTSPYEQSQDPVAVVRPSFDPTEVLPVGRVDGSSPASAAVVDMSGLNPESPDQSFFNLPALSRTDFLKEIDETELDPDTQAAFLFLRGLDRQETAHDRATLLEAQALSDVYVQRRKDRADRDQARRSRGYDILDAQVEKNEAAATAAVEANRYARHMQEKRGIDEDLIADNQALIGLRSEHKQLRQQRDALQAEYDGVKLRHKELASGLTADGEEIQALQEAERELYITLGNQYGSLLGMDAGQYVPGSREERLRAAAVIEAVYFPDYLRRTDEFRQAIRDLQTQIDALQEETTRKENTRLRAAQDRLRESYESKEMADATFEHRAARLAEAIQLAHLIPGPPRESLLEAARNEVARRLGQVADQEMVQVERRPEAPESRGLNASTQPSRRLETGGRLFRLRGAQLTLPPKKAN